MNHRLMPKTLFTMVMLVAVVVSLTGASANGSRLGSTPVYDEDAEFVPGEVIVGLEGSGSAQVLATQVQGQVVASIDPLNAHLIKLPDGAQVEQAVATLQASGDVAWAEPNYIGHILAEPADSPLMATPNDPLRGSQWALGSGFLNMYNAWNKTKGSTAANKAVAVLDTGADMDHPDLNSKLLTSRDWDFVNGDGTPQDDHNHGSHVAGIAAAETNNGTGVAGVAWENKIIPIKVCNAFGGCTAWDTAQGMVHAVLQQATVINMSLGWDQPAAVLRSAADFAWRSNVVVVAAAGNDGTFEDSYPAAFDSVVSVASTNSSDLRSSFSTYHSTVEVSAPGGTGGAADSDDILSANMSGGYMYMYGTSMATPQVVGAAALYRSRYPGATAARTRACLRRGDEKGLGGWDQYYGWGRLDVNKVLACPPFGARVLIDNTHSNINYTATGFRYDRFGGVAEDLNAMGFKVSWTSSSGLNSTSLNSTDILILTDPHTSYTTSERSAIASWINNTWGKRMIALCEYGPFNDNAELNTLLSQLGTGIQCANALVQEPSQYDYWSQWPIINNFNRTWQRTNTSVYETGLYAGTYLTIGSPAVWLASTTSSATASTANLLSGELDETGVTVSENAQAEVEISDIQLGTYYVAAMSKAGPKSARVWVFGDSTFVGYQDYPDRMPNTRLWFDNAIGGWE